jgi:transcriptional repressor NrdR
MKWNVHIVIILKQKSPTPEIREASQFVEDVSVLKKDGRREKFDRSKLKKGVMKALEKRPVSHEKIEEMINYIEEKIRRTGTEEIESSAIGEYVMDSLKETDQVAYIRFASVYRSFTDVTFFEKEIKNLTKEEIAEKR